MKLVDYGISAAASAAYSLWGRVPGVAGFSRRANATALKLGAEPLRTVKLATGAKMRIDLRSGGQWPMFYKRNADRFWIDTACALLTDDALFLDVGANIGIYTCQVAAMKRVAGQCHAFEPMPGNVARLRENVAINGIERFAEIYPYGLSDEAKTLHLAYVRANGADTGNAEIVLDRDAAAGRELFDIEVRRLDEVALPDRPIGVMKIDVEGHEDFAYSGGKERLAKDRPFIIAEYNRMELAERGLGPELAFATYLPDGYVAMRGAGARFEPLTDWNALNRIENFLIVPEERMERVSGIHG